MSKKTKKNRNSEGFNPFWELSRKIDAQMEQDGKNPKETITGTVNDDVDSVMSTSTPKNHVDEISVQEKKEEMQENGRTNGNSEKGDEKARFDKLYKNILSSTNIGTLLVENFKLKGKIRSLENSVLKARTEQERNFELKRYEKAINELKVLTEARNIMVEKIRSKIPSVSENVA